MKYKTIIWRNIPKVKITIDEFNELIDEIKGEGFIPSRLNNVSREIRACHTYEIINKENFVELKVSYGKGDNRRYYVPKTFENDELKDTSKITGKEAYDYVDELFKSNNKDLSLYRAFSGQKYIPIYRLIKNCVPIQISYINKALSKRVNNNCFKADVSSAFPFQLTKNLPTLHDYKRVEGYAEPTEDYPFAFYINSGHIKIYNELDTRNLNNLYFDKYEKSYNDNVETEITILCKSSQYSLKEEFEYMYAHRKEDENQKMYMNACIGFFHKNTDPRLSHIAAVVIARNNKQMMDRVMMLKKEGNAILYIATDSIVWIGHKSSITANKKELGAFVDEGTGKFYGVQVGSYQFLFDNGELLTKCTYLKNGEEKDSIKFSQLPEPKHETKLFFDKETHKIERIM